MIHAEQRRDIEPCVMGQSPGHSWSDEKTVVRRATTFLIAEAAKLAFNSGLKLFDQSARLSYWLKIFALPAFVIGRRSWRPFMEKMNRSDDALGDTPFPAAITRCQFLFKEGV